MRDVLRRVQRTRRTDRLLVTYIVIGLAVAGATWVFLSGHSTPVPAPTVTASTHHAEALGASIPSVATARKFLAEEDAGQGAWDETKHAILVFGDVTEPSIQRDLDRFRALPHRFYVHSFSGGDSARVMFVQAAYIGPKDGFVWDPLSSSTGLLQSLQEHIFHRVVFATDRDDSVTFFSRPRAGGRETEHFRLERGQQNEGSVPLLHEVVARDSATGQELQRWVVTDPGLFTIRNPGDCNYVKNPATCHLRAKPTATQQSQVAEQVQRELERQLALARDQPPTVRNFTRVGFEKRAVPKELLRFLKTYLDLNKYNYRTEEWDTLELSLQGGAPSLKVAIPEDPQGAVGYMNSILSPILSEWAGNVPLESTAVYGIRLYTKGARLFDHVDLQSTHIISAIVNVDQDFLDPGWPLDILDHDGTMHHVAMKPGEMVMYEGATCMHGRNVYPFEGRLFANLFFHFKPDLPEFAAS